MIDVPVCSSCNDSGFSGAGTGYGDVCSECGGTSPAFTERTYPGLEAIEAAINAARQSPCAKSKRGASLITFGSGGPYPAAWNGPAIGSCDGSETCKRDCSKICIHAETALLIQERPTRGTEIVHVKVIEGQPVASGPPSCWQCSRLILAAQVSAVWLLHNDGWKRYAARVFHERTLENERLHVSR